MKGVLRETVYVTLNGSGAGTAKVGPLSAREMWYPETVTVNANANPTNESQCSISVGDANTLRLRDITVNGSSGDSTGKISGDVIRCGEFVWATWTGGDAGQRAQMTVMGTKEV